MPGCGTRGWSVVNTTAGLGEWLDSMGLEGFSDLNDSMGLICTFLWGGSPHKLSPNGHESESPAGISCSSHCPQDLSWTLVPLFAADKTFQRNADKLLPAKPLIFCQNAGIAEYF